MMSSNITAEFWDIIRAEFNERRFGEILEETEIPPNGATRYKKIVNLARVYYLNGFNDGIKTILKLKELEK